MFQKRIAEVPQVGWKRGIVHQLMDNIGRLIVSQIIA